MRSLEAQLLFAALLYTSGTGGLRYNLGTRFAPSLQDIVNTATDPPPTNTTEGYHRPDICCWDDAPSLAPTVVLRPSHPDAVADPTWAETLRTATWRALGEGSGRSPPWQELSAAPFSSSASRPPPPPDREVALLARGVLIRGSDDLLRFTEDCVCDKSAEAAGVLATWGVRRLRHSGPNELHRPYYELQFSASALLPALSRPVTVLPPGGQSAPVAKGIVFNLTGTRKMFFPPDPEVSTRLPVQEDRQNTTTTTPKLETAAAEVTKPATIAIVTSTPVSLETADTFRVPDPTVVVFESVSTERSSNPVSSSKPEPTTSSTTPSPPPTTTSTSTTSTTEVTTSSSPATAEATAETPATEGSTPPRPSSPFRVSLLTPPALGRLLDSSTSPPTTFRPPWRPRIRPRSKISIVETRTTYKVSAERRPKRP